MIVDNRHRTRDTCTNRGVECRSYWLVRIRQAVPGAWPKTEVLERVAW